MKRKYYYNRHIPRSDTFISENEYSSDENMKYVHGNKQLKKQLVKANQIVKVSISTMKDILVFIGQHSGSFCTKVGLKEISKGIGCSLRTVSKAMKGFRLTGIILVYHRYKGEGPTRRRTTSLIILKAFNEFCSWLKKMVSNVQTFKFMGFFKGKANKLTNDYAIINLSTGEIVAT